MFGDAGEVWLLEAGRDEDCASAGWVAFGEGPAASQAILIAERAESRAGMSLVVGGIQGARAFEDNMDV